MTMGSCRIDTISYNFNERVWRTTLPFFSIIHGLIYVEVKPIDL
jgi:hypothetical protein